MPQHKVQSGETLSAIASKYQVSLSAIKNENPIIKDVNHIEAGWNRSIYASSGRACTLCVGAGHGIFLVIVGLLLLFRNDGWI